MMQEFDQDVLLQALLDRESVGSTAIDTGLAVPHAKVASAKKIQVCFARSRTGIQWDAPDRQLVHLFFLMVAPPTAAAQYLETLATLCRFLRDSSNRSLLVKASDEDLATIFATAKELQ